MTRPLHCERSGERPHLKLTLLSEECARDPGPPITTRITVKEKNITNKLLESKHSKIKTMLDTLIGEK